MSYVYQLPAPVFGVAVWLALWLGACSGARPIPPVEITAAQVSGSVLVEGTIGAIPWAVVAEGDQGGGSVCVTVWAWQFCEHTPE